MPLILFGMASILCLSWCGCDVGEAAEEPVARADVVVVSELALFAGLERASVQFPHDLHTEMMKERKEDCTSCHLLDAGGRLSAKFARLEDLGEEPLIDLYHDRCIGCHQEREQLNQASGPVACGQCHRRRPAYVSARRPFGLDKSLHYRHVKASKEKCDGCHHLYDEAKKKLVYVKGEESSCRDCHREQTEGNRSAFKVAAHQACIGCHRDPSTELAKSDSPRPQSCAGCHDEEHQVLIKVVAEVPRLKTKQADFILLSAAKTDLEASKLRTVPFSHVDHERDAATCRSCHHETLDACSSCHTLLGSDQSEGVTLYQAMHGMAAEASCVGCHVLETATAECAGCHAPMPSGQPLEDGCDTCHAGPVPEKVEIERAQYESLDSFRAVPSGERAGSAALEVPETVTMGALSNEYERAEMPHRKIVEKLRQYVRKNSAAMYFHRPDEILCQGCHHQSPVGEKPPLCRSCHGMEAAGTAVGTPGLRGAYHRQCLGCHQSMGIEKPSDCFGCHAEKQERVAGVVSGALR